MSRLWSAIYLVLALSGCSPCAWYWGSGECPQTEIRK